MYYAEYCISFSKGLSSNKIIPIGEEEFTKVKIVGGTRKRKLFEEAVDDIRNEYKYYYLKVPRIEAVLDKNIKSSPVELPLINPAVAKYCDSNMNLKTTASKM